VGIGFAIPVNLAKRISDELKSSGMVSRGWLGILPADIDNNMAEALGMAKPEGVLVESVEDDSPAEEGGLQVGDVIIEVDGQKVKDAQQFRFLIADAGPGTEVRMKVNRDGDNKSLKFKLGDRSEFLNIAASSDENKSAKKWLGLDVTTLTSRDAERMGIEFEPSVIIDSVEPGSAADEAGLFQGDLILEIDHQRIQSRDDFIDQAGRLKDRTKSILFLIKRGNRTLHKAVKPM
jgi:serine protease Do